MYEEALKKQDISKPNPAEDMWDKRGALLNEGGQIPKGGGAVGGSGVEQESSSTPKNVLLFF
jgi:hypothetical protein